MRFEELAGYIGVVAAVSGLTAVFLSTVICGPGCGEEARMWSDWNEEGSFSWSVNALSDLGVSSVAPLFNYSLVVVGALNFVFTLGLLRRYGGGALFSVGVLFLVLGGGSLSLVGVFTEAYGALLHSAVSLGYFVMLPVGMLLVGVGFLRTGWDDEGKWSVVAGAAALIVILLGIAPGWHRWLGLGFGVPEYVEALVIGFWVALMGARLARRPTKVEVRAS